MRDMIRVMHEMSIVSSFIPPSLATVSSNFPSVESMTYMSLVELNNLDAPTMLHYIIILKKELELLKQVQTEKMTMLMISNQS